MKKVQQKTKFTMMFAVMMMIYNILGDTKSVPEVKNHPKATKLVIIAVMPKIHCNISFLLIINDLILK